jgi:exonuclease VII large subunit
LDQENQALDFYNKQHSVLSPNSILARGFSITRKDGKAVLNQDILKAGDLIEIELMDGKKLANIT